MAKHIDLFGFQNVSGDDSATVEYPPIASNKSFIITIFGAVDVNNGDHKSTTYLLKYGSSNIRALAFSGNSGQISMRVPLIGDGVKFVSVVINNHSSQSKQCTFWLHAEQG